VGSALCARYLDRVKISQWADSAVRAAVDGLRWTAARLDGSVRSLRDRRLRRRLSGSEQLDFSDDYTSSRVAHWQSCLAPFVGRERIDLLEVGVFEGRSTLWFLDHVLTHPTSRATCIDSFGRTGGEPRFDHNIAIAGQSNRVTKLKGLSVDLLPRLADHRFDIIYIDGSHHAPDVLMDAFLCWRTLAPGGVMIFDDYLWELEREPWRRPKMAIDLFLATVGGEAEVLHDSYQIVIARRG
jgi:hypothetical protein